MAVSAIVADAEKKKKAEEPNYFAGLRHLDSNQDVRVSFVYLFYLCLLPA